MWPQLFSALWRRIPKRARRWGVLLTQPRFTVSTGAVIFDRKNRILLLHHRFRAGSGWGLPGGFLKPREAPEAGLRRELREEIGLEIEEVEIVQLRTLETYQQVEILFCGHPANLPQPRSVEISQAAWFELHSLPEHLSPDQQRLIRQAVAFRERRNFKPPSSRGSAE